MDVLNQDGGLVYKTDFWDKRQWKRFLELSQDQSLRQLIDEVGVTLYSFPQLALEVYTSFYKAWGLQRVEPGLPENQWARAIFDELEARPDFNDLKRRLKSDFFLCGIAASTFIREIATALPQPEKPFDDPDKVRQQVVVQKQKSQCQQSNQSQSGEGQTQSGAKGKSPKQSQSSAQPGQGQPSPGGQSQSGQGRSPDAKAQGQGADQTQSSDQSQANGQKEGDEQGTDQTPRSGSESGQSDGVQSGDSSQSGDHEGNQPGENASATGEGSLSGQSGQPSGGSSGDGQSQGAGASEASAKGGSTSSGGSPFGNNPLQQQAAQALAGDREDPEANQSTPQSKQSPRPDAKTQAMIRKLVEQGREARGRLDDFSKKVELMAGEMIERALMKTDHAVTQAEAMIDGFAWGVGGGDPHATGDLETKIKLHKRFVNDSKIRDICQMAGRLKKEAADKMRHQSRQSHTTFEDVTTGNRLDRLMGSEYLNFFDPDLELIFYKRYAERSLTEKLLSGEDRVTEGPIVFLKDISGSTSGWINEFICALSMAFQGIAAHQKRHFRLVQFDDRRGGRGSAVRRVDDFKPGEVDFDRLLETIDYFTGGGTNWMDPLDSAVECIKKEQYYRDADIVLCTDGECGVEPSWLKRFKQQQEELGFTVFGIIVGDESATNMTHFIPNKQILRVTSNRGEVVASQVAEAFAL